MGKKQTVVFELLSAIPTGAEIKQFIFENDADEKMLDEWLWQKIYNAKDWKKLEREQIEEAIELCVLEDRRLLRQSSCFSVPILPRPKDAANYYTQTFKP